MGYAPRQIELSFAVKQNNTESLFAALEAVSDPSSASYGSHLSNQEVQAMVAPLPEAVQAVMKHLEDHGVKGSCVTQNCDFVTAVVSIEKAELLLATKSSV